MDLGKNQWIRSRTGSWLKPSSSSRQRVVAYEKELYDWFVKINVQINISLALRLERLAKSFWAFVTLDEA